MTVYFGFILIETKKFHKTLWFLIKMARTWLRILQSFCLELKWFLQSSIHNDFQTFQKSWRQSLNKTWVKGVPIGVIWGQILLGNLSEGQRIPEIKYLLKWFMIMTHIDDSNLVDSCMCWVNVVMIQVIPILLAFLGSIGLRIDDESFSHLRNNYP